jgi:choline-glycine betaine transporter
MCQEHVKMAIPCARNMSRWQYRVPGAVLCVHCNIMHLYVLTTVWQFCFVLFCFVSRFGAVTLRMKQMKTGKKKEEQE